MKKILIAVTLLGLSSTAFATNCKSGQSYGNDGSVCKGALDAYTTTTEQNKIDSAQNVKINAATSNAAAALNVANQANAAVAGKADQSSLNDVSVKTDHAFDIAVEGRATANNALSTVYGLIPQVLNNEKAIADVNNKVDTKVDTDAQALRDNGQDEHINAVQSAAQTANDRASDLEKRADTVEQNVRDTNKQLEVTDARSIDNANRLDSVESKNNEQDSLISTKADKSSLNKEISDRVSADKKLQNQINANNMHDVIQDAAIVGLDVTKANKRDLAKEVQDRKNADKVLSDRVDTKVDKSVYSTDKAAQKTTDENQDKLINTKAARESVDNEISSRQANDAALDSKIENNKVAQSKIDAEQNSTIKSESTARTKADNALNARIDNNDATLVQHDQRITSNTQRVGAVENRVQNLEQSTNKRFSDMDKRVGENRKVASAGIAGAGAMANIPQVSQGSTFSVGAGVGGYDSEQAVAVGLSARVNNNVVTKMSVSTNTQSEVLWGAGVGVEW